MRYSNPDVDALFDRYDAATDNEETQDAGRAVNAKLAEELPCLLLWPCGWS